MPPAFADACVQRGEDVLAALAATVTALYEHPAYRRLAGDATTPGCPLSGTSRIAADTAVAAVRRLLADYEDYAIDGGNASADFAADLARRGAEARATLDAFARAWTQLPTLFVHAQAQGAQLLERARALPAEGLATELVALTERIGQLSAESTLDPLGAFAALQGEIPTAIARLDDALTAAHCARSELTRRLAAAAMRGAALLSSQTAALPRMQAHAARILDPTAPPLPTDSLLRALLDWREKLAHSATTVQWPAAARALGAWEQRAGECEEQIRAALARAEADLADRHQLRGWLRALQAKAGALGQAENARFSAAALEAHRLLHSRPTPLARVRSLLSTCQSLLTHAH